MADTITTYKRSKSDAQITRSIRVPGSGGMAAQTSATMKYIEGLDQFAKAGGRLAMSYVTAIENRERRDADTTASKLFRERRIDILQNVKGKDADGLLDREDKWQKDQFDKWVKDHDIEMVAAKEIWRRHADSYLDRTGSYMMEQQAIYDKQSKLMASDEANDGLVDTAIGDLTALEVVFAENKTLFGDDPMTGEKQNDKAIMTAIGARARQNPRATVNWFNQNKESLKKKFGAKFLTVTDVIDRAERKIQQEVQHAEVLAARTERLNAKAQKEYSNGVLRDFFTLLVRGEADKAAIDAITDDPRVSFSDAHTAFQLWKGVEEAERKAEDAANKSWQEECKQSVLTDIAQYGYDSPEVQSKINVFTKNGDLTTTMLSALKSAGEQFAKIPDSAKTYVSDAYAYVKDMYAGPVPFGQVQSQQRLEQENRMRNAISARVKESPNTVAEDFNQNDPNSWINKLVRANPPVESKLTGVISGPYMPGYTSVNQANKQAIVPPMTPIKPAGKTGNTIMDRLNARKGK